MKFFIKDLFSKCEQIRSFLRIWSYLLKRPLMENFMFCAVMTRLFHTLWCSVQKIFSITECSTFLKTLENMGSVCTEKIVAPIRGPVWKITTLYSEIVRKVLLWQPVRIVFDNISGKICQSHISRLLITQYN